MITAEQHLREACAEQPRALDRRVALARALTVAGRFRSATEVYFDAFADGLHHPAMLTNLGASLYDEGRVAEAVTAYRCALARDPQFTPAWSNLLLALNCLEHLSPAEVAGEHRRFGEQFELPERLPACLEPRSSRRLRLGFVSSAFRCHVAGQFAEPVLRLLDRDRFEIFVYQADEQTDAITEGFQTLADHWRVIASLDDAAALAIIRADNIDVLVDLDGHTGNNRLGVFAARAARVQVSWLGYPNTTGLRTMDYRITDTIADPASWTEQLHTEKLIRLEPPFLVYTAPEGSPAVRPPPVFRNGHVTFGLFCQLHKLSDALVRAVGGILQRVPQARLLLQCASLGDPHVSAAVLRRFTERGIAEHRIVTVGHIPGAAAHLEMHSRVDILLDPFPYNGTTATCEALWMGLPVVTLEGAAHAARVGSTLLRAVGRGELVGKTLEEYADIAVELAFDSARLATLRASARERMQASPLMDARAFVQRFQNALLEIR